MPLTLLFQRTLSAGKIPRDWKDARITPIFKKGNKTSARNYRPVSLTSVVCKTPEKLVRKHIIIHLQQNELLSNDQYGFRTGRSCSLQLLHMLNDWCEFIENNESSDTIYLDLAKAFDKVPHQRLLKKVSSYGIKGPLLSWIRDFLSNRRQQVSIKRNSSS